MNNAPQISCPKCGQLIDKSSVSCKYCGTVLSAGVGAGSRFGASSGGGFNGYPPNPYGSNGAGLSNDNFDPRISFVEADECPVASLENGVIANMITGEGVKTEGIMITQRRLYYNFDVGVLKKRKENDVIELKDISATKLKSECNWWFVVLSFLNLFAVVISFFATNQKRGANYQLIVLFAFFTLFFLVMYFFSIHKSFRVEYAGGCISFNLRGYSLNNMLDFQKAIHFYKCKLDHADSK